MKLLRFVSFFLVESGEHYIGLLPVQTVVESDLELLRFLKLFLDESGKHYSIDHWYCSLLKEGQFVV